MDIAQEFQSKFEKILNKLKTLKVINSYNLKIKFFEFDDNIKKYLKEVNSVLKKCLKKIMKPKKAEIRNIITELVRKKNLNNNAESVIMHDKAQKEICDAFSSHLILEKSCSENIACKSSPELFKHHVGHFFECPNCPLTFSSDQDYHKHLKIYEKPDKDGILYRTPGASLATENISSSACINQSLQQKGTAQLKKKAVKYRVSSTQYSCTCGKEFRLVESLKKHIKLKHSGKNMEYSCSVCEKRFHEKGKLNRHMLSHKVKQYQCSLCSKEFARSDALKRHLSVSHNLTKNFSCSFCDKKFSLKHNRDVHEENVHQNSNNWIQCEICGQKLRSKVTFKSHLRIHKDKKVQCTLCNKSFSRKVYYKIHLKSKHLEISPYQNLLDSVVTDEAMP